MITGFEKETKDLSGKEQRMSHFLVRILQHHIGKENAITNGRLASILEDQYGEKVHGSRMRKILRHIKMKNLVQNLIATNTGYFVGTEEEVLEYVVSLRERRYAIKLLEDSYNVNPEQLRIWISSSEKKSLQSVR